LSTLSAANQPTVTTKTSEVKVRTSRLLIALALKRISITTKTLRRQILVSLLSELTEGVIDPSKVTTITTKVSNATKSLTNVSIPKMTLRTNSETDFYWTVILCTATENTNFCLTKKSLFF